MHSGDRFVLLIPLCAAVAAFCSLAWHGSAPAHFRTAEARLRHLRGWQLGASAEGAWDLSTHSDHADWPRELWAEPAMNAAPAHVASVDANTDAEASAANCDAGTGKGSASGREEDDAFGGGHRRHSDAGGQEEAAGGDEFDAEGDVEDEKRVGMCAAAAAEQVQCVLSSGGGARGECGTRKLAACLSRLAIMQADPSSATVIAHTRYGRMVLPLADSFQGLALLFYGEWLEWGLNVLLPLLKAVPKAATVLDVNPGAGGGTLALAHMLGKQGRVYVAESRGFLMQSLAASAELVNSSAARIEFWPCLSSVREVTQVLQVNATRATGLGQVAGDDALYAHERLRVACSTIDWEMTQRNMIDPSVGDRQIDLIRVSACALQHWREVLRGAAETLRRWRPMLYVESSSRGAAAGDVEAFLAQDLALEDYHCYWSAGRLFRAGNWRAVRTNIYDDSLSVFYQLCLPARIHLQGLQRVQADPLHKHRQLALGDVLLSSFVRIDVAAIERVLLPASVSPRPVTARATRLLEYPHMVQVDGFLDASECLHLIDLARSRKRESAVGVGAGGAGGGAEVRDTRRSWSSVLPHNDTTVLSVRRRAASVFAAEDSHLERLQVVEYGEGGVYELHSDAFPMAGAGAEDLDAHAARGGQRIGALASLSMSALSRPRLCACQCVCVCARARAHLHDCADACGV